METPRLALLLLIAALPRHSGGAAAAGIFARVHRSNQPQEEANGVLREWRHTISAGLRSVPKLAPRKSRVQLPSNAETSFPQYFSVDALFRPRRRSSGVEALDVSNEAGDGAKGPLNSLRLAYHNFRDSRELNKHGSAVREMIDTRGERLDSGKKDSNTAIEEPTASKRVLILISDTGGGHRASAQALEAAFADLRPGELDVSIVDIWTENGRWPHNTFVSGYQHAAQNQWIWRSMYYASAFPPFMAVLNLHAHINCFDSFYRRIKEEDPALVVSMHPLCQNLPLKILTKMGGGRRKIPFATVVTDLGGAHPSWFHKGVDACFLPSDAVRKIALRRGVSASKLVQHGLPVRQAFWQPAPARTQLVQELGLSEDRKTVLVVGGGDGVGSLEKIVEATAVEAARVCPDEAQIVAVCGKNAELRRRLASKQYANVTVQVKGFVKRMSDYMQVADCLVTKAGPGTIAEACTRGLPMMLSSFLPGQEAGNVPFVTKGGFGDYSQKPLVIATTVCGWLQHPEQLEEMSGRALAAASPRAAMTIAADLCDMLEAAEDGADQY